MDESKCKSCGARIGWVRTSSGRRMPVDLPRQQMFEIDANGYARAVMVVQSHFVTCPFADRHRRAT